MKETYARIILGLIGASIGLAAFFARDWLGSQGPWTMAAIIAAWAGTTFIIATRFPSKSKVSDEHQQTSFVLLHSPELRVHPNVMIVPNYMDLTPSPAILAHLAIGKPDKRNRISLSSFHLAVSSWKSSDSKPNLLPVGDILCGETT